MALNTKVRGTWNLHDLLPLGMDFFIMLASINGIGGGRAQANYAAGNNFQDALAHHRIARGEKAVSIDLGLMTTDGIVAESPELLASMRRVGHLMDLQAADLLAFLDYYCDAARPLVLAQDAAQVIFGLETVAAVRAKGIDLHHSVHRPTFRQLFRMDVQGTGRGDAATAGVVDYPATLRRAATDAEAATLVTGWFRAKVGQILGLQEEDVDTNRPVHSMASTRWW